MRLRTLLALLVLVTSAAAPGGSAFAQRSGFPHTRHAKLFPNCAGCHEGIFSGVASRQLPAASACASCHNGRDVREVSWAGASTTKRPTNLRFSHTEHATTSAARGSLATCTSCHTTAGDTAWMHVRPAQAAGCLTCHRAPEHLAESATCKNCHVTLVEARSLTVSQIAAFPKPASHAQPAFASAHAPRSDVDVARCATCHTRESCTRCHANAAKLPVIAQLGSDSRVAELMRGRAAVYPIPASHTQQGWELEHGVPAVKGAQGCANCHTQASCRSCHIGAKGEAAIAQLTPVALTSERATVGVPPSRKAVHPRDFAKAHKSTAASGRLDCLGCHEQRQCTSCHEGSGARRYHAANFVGRHASDAYGQEQNCSSCHRTETFCRSCHQKTGVTVSGARTGAVHTGQPLWLLQHGQAARQGLTGCTSCHQQRDCLACHSNLGLHVNPHGLDFNASRMSARNKAMCTTCHVKDPLQK